MKLIGRERIQFEHLQDVLKQIPDDPLKDFMDDSDVENVLRMLVRIIEREMKKGK